MIGSRLDIRQTGSDEKDFARNAYIVQIDIDPAQLNNRIHAKLNICSNAESFFTNFTLTSDTFSNTLPSWLTELTKKRDLSQINEYQDWKISPSEIFKKLNSKLKDCPINYVCDVGNHQMWAAQNLRLAPQHTVHYSGGMGAMGFALPAAIGIAIQSKNKVIVVTGDGSLQINIQELDTLHRLNLDIVILIMNNFSLGMVKNFQDMYFNGRDQSTRKGYSAPSFSSIAKAYGIKSHHVVGSSEIENIIDLIKENKGPLLIEVEMEGATECRPRLSFGSKLDNQIPKLNE